MPTVQVCYLFYDQKESSLNFFKYTVMSSVQYLNFCNKYTNIFQSHATIGVQNHNFQYCTQDRSYCLV
jgi:hypothetical protein